MMTNRWSLGISALVVAMASAPATAQEATAIEIAGKMGTVVDDLGKKQTGTPVQTEQKTIVRDLDALIASLEKQAQQARGGIKNNRPLRGMEESEIRSGNGEIGPLTNPNDGGKDWGKLTERERDRILQSMTEGFPPEYRTVLERYYRRLAEEKSAKGPADASRKDKAAAKP